jgi:hypothetical protein
MVNLSRRTPLTCDLDELQLYAMKVARALWMEELEARTSEARMMIRQLVMRMVSLAPLHP